MLPRYILIRTVVFPPVVLWVQLTMERTETDTRQRLNNRIEHLEAELGSMKTKLDQEVAQRHSLGRSMDVRFKGVCVYICQVDTD